jgi:hypothetical protein
MANQPKATQAASRLSCLLCKLHKLSTAKKTERRRGRRTAMLHEFRAAHDARQSPDRDRHNGAEPRAL